MELEQKLRTKSCFYVAVLSSADRLSSPDDVTYDFRHPSITKALRTAVTGGWEVGLHASINAKTIFHGIEIEKRMLEDSLDGYRVRGVRHHYWAMEPQLPEQTLWSHVAAGFQYDSSLGLNDIPGFRRGMAWPFQPFDRDRGKSVPIVEIPPTLMDGGIFYRDVSHDEGHIELQRHFERAFQYGGAVVLDWHLEQLNPSRLRGAGPALSRVLLDLVSNSDIFWASPAELTTWWQNRRKRLAL
jgi:hypothetical protein